MIDLNLVAEKSAINAKKRAMNGGNIKADSKSMVKHCATEVIEVLDALDLYDGCQKQKLAAESLQVDISPEIVTVAHYELAGELADVICCCLIIAANEGIDIEEALKSCLYKNTLRAMKKGDKL